MNGNGTEKHRNVASCKPYLSHICVPLCLYGLYQRYLRALVVLPSGKSCLHVISVPSIHYLFGSSSLMVGKSRFRACHSRAGGNPVLFKHIEKNLLTLIVVYLDSRLRGNDNG
ncbi:MAG TPA: hypothetical protein PKH19_05095, partial [Candidatus Syntrophosphaera sp.]|nr:hypothetical protein [Candidatus Syntrophosphaera sp.]